MLVFTPKLYTNLFVKRSGQNKARDLNRTLDYHIFLYSLKDAGLPSFIDISLSYLYTYVEDFPLFNNVVEDYHQRRHTI